MQEYSNKIASSEIIYPIVISNQVVTYLKFMKLVTHDEGSHCIRDHCTEDTGHTKH